MPMRVRGNSSSKKKMRRLGVIVSATLMLVCVLTLAPHGVHAIEEVRQKEERGCLVGWGTGYVPMATSP